MTAFALQAKKKSNTRRAGKFWPTPSEEGHWFSAGGDGPNNCRPMMPSAAVRLAVAVGLVVGIFGRENTGGVAARNNPNHVANAHHHEQLLRRLGHDEPTPSPSLDPDDEETVAIIDGQPRQIDAPGWTDEPTGTLTPEPTASDMVDQMIMEEFEEMGVPTPRPTEFRVVTTDEPTGDSEFAPSVVVLFCAYAWRCTGYVKTKGKRMPHRPFLRLLLQLPTYAHSSYILYISPFFLISTTNPKQVPGGNQLKSRPSGRRPGRRADRRPVPPRRP